jgi:hypothetical protein
MSSPVESSSILDSEVRCTPFIRCCCVELQNLQKGAKYLRQHFRSGMCRIHPSIQLSLAQNLYSAGTVQFSVQPGVVKAGRWRG